MQGLYVAMAALVCLFAGIGAAVFAFAFWYLLKTVKEMTKTVQSLSEVGSELLGQGSFRKISSAMVTVAENLPGMMEAFNTFSKTMKVFHKAAFNTEEPAASGSIPSEEKTSAFYPYDEAQAAENERVDRSKRDNLILTKDQMKGMRTDDESRAATQTE